MVQFAVQNPPFDETRAFVAVFFTWFLSQFIKYMRAYLKKQPAKGYKWIFDTGGMPSSHSATVSCLATAVGMYSGFQSISFLIALIFSLITMFDAAGVRRNMGRQARVLNQILDELSKGRAVQDAKLKELLGHTPVEVFVGAFLGMLIAYIFCGI